MSCKDCEYSSHCVDAYTEVSHLCNNYESEEKHMTDNELKTMIEEGLEANMNFLANMDTGMFYATISTAIVEYLHRNPSVDWEKLASKLVENIVTAPAMVEVIYGKE